MPLTHYAQSHSHAQIRETDVRDYFLMPAHRAGKRPIRQIPLSTRRLVRRAR